MNKLIVVEGFTPAVGDGLLYVGGSWKHIAPSMEAYAVDRLMRENEILKKRIQELEADK